MSRVALDEEAGRRAGELFEGLRKSRVAEWDERETGGIDRRLGAFVVEGRHPGPEALGRFPAPAPFQQGGRVRLPDFLSRPLTK